MTQGKPERNQAIECARMVAACFVVFIHCAFPGTFGGLIDCLGKFAVPMFFAISGYFCFQTASEKIWSRMLRVLKLYFFAALGYLIWGICYTEYQGGSSIAYLHATIPEIDEVARWLFWSVPPYMGHLWYLLAVAVCYAMLWLYVKFFDGKAVDYRPAYLLGACLLADAMAADALTARVGGELRFHWYSTALLNGVPMFALGMFMREHKERIRGIFAVNTPKALCMILAGGLLSVIQWRGGVSTGIYFGALMEVVGLILLLNLHPVIVRPDCFLAKWISHFGYLSMMVYILHVMAMDAYDLFAEPAMKGLLGPSEPWVRPLVVLGMSLLAAILCDCFRSLVRRK